MTSSAIASATTLAGLLIAGAGYASTPTNEQLIRSLFEAFNNHDAKALSQFYADDAQVYSPEQCEPTVGPQAIASSYQELFAQIPDVHDELEIMLSDGNRVALVFTASSRIPGAEFELPIAAVLRIEEGKIVEDRVFFQSDTPAQCNGEG